MVLDSRWNVQALLNKSIRCQSGSSLCELSPVVLLSPFSVRLISSLVQTKVYAQALQ